MITVIMHHASEGQNREAAPEGLVRIGKIMKGANGERHGFQPGERVVIPPSAGIRFRIRESGIQGTLVSTRDILGRIDEDGAFIRKDAEK